MKLQINRQLSRLFVAIATLSALGTPAFATSGTWTPTSGTQSWNSNGNWNPNTGFPGTAAGDTANVTSALTAAETINLNQNITLGTLNIGASTANSFTVATGTTGGQLTLNNNDAGASINQNAGSNGDTISAPIVIADTLANTITNASATNAFTISGGITGSQNLTLQANAAGGLTIQTGAINNAGTVTNSGSGSGSVYINTTFGTNVTGVTQNSTTSSLVLGNNNNTADTIIYNISNGTLQAGGSNNFGAKSTINFANVAGATLALGSSGRSRAGVPPAVISLIPELLRLTAPMSHPPTGVASADRVTLLLILPELRL
jgi:hypothetical protein